MTNRLIGKIFISGRIVAETGLHIGGSKTSLDIGGVDLNVIKTPHGRPFIPGSSLKGKLRSMLARTEGSVAVNRNDLKPGERPKADTGEIKIDPHFPYIIQLFGSSGDQEEDTPEVTRLIVRDATLDEESFKTKFETRKSDLDFDYSYVKWENTINRRTGTAQHPRQLERVPAGAEFNFELVYDLYDDTGNEYVEGKEETILEKHKNSLLTAMELLQDDFIGGHGSRGYGQISFKNLEVKQRLIDEQTGKYGEREDAAGWSGFTEKFQ